jgi:hypothetical protein
LAEQHHKFGAFTGYRSPSVHPNPYHLEKVLSATKLILSTPQIIAYLMFFRVNEHPN